MNNNSFLGILLIIIIVFLITVTSTSVRADFGGGGKIEKNPEFFVYR